jgi:hypothetical protein
MGDYLSVLEVGKLAIEDALLSGLIMGITIVICGYVTLKSGLLDDKISKIMEDFVLSFQTNEELQKALYAIGALIGNGAKTGLGLTRSGGKFGFKDIMAQIVGGFVNRYIPQGINEPRPQEDDRFKL